MSAPQHIRLSELNTRIKQVIDQAFQFTSFWVIADITNHNFQQNKNHHYFELVEKAEGSNNVVAKISGRAWTAGSAKIAGFEKITGQHFTNNINVLINVSVQFHEAYGLSVTLLDIDSNFTIGMLEQQRRATLERLLRENDFIEQTGDRYITRNSRLKLNPIIQRIAIIASRNSAGNEDFRHTLEQNGFDYRFMIDDYFVTVQGDGNAEQFRRKLIEVFQAKKAYDAVVIIRGGGAQTDFLIFEDYYVGQAVAKFPIPIITGIGHQRNETITDLMAHTSMKTPTKAAEFIIAHNRAFEDSINNFQKNIIIKTQRIFSSQMQILNAVNSNLVNQTRNLLTQHQEDLVRINQVTINTSKSILFQHQNFLVRVAAGIVTRPSTMISSRRNDLTNRINNLNTFKSQYFKNQAGYLRHFVSIINIMSPENILKKGFAIVKLNNRVTGNPDEIKVGNTIDIILRETEIKALVKQKSTNDGREFKL